jgi:hypothetical protein
MFAELPSIEHRNDRAAWAAGALGVVSELVRLRAASVVSPSVWIAIVLSLTGLIVFAIGAQSDVEAAGMDDDVFLRFAWLATSLLAGSAIVAIIRVFVVSDELSGRRH